MAILLNVLVRYSIFSPVVVVDPHEYLVHDGSAAGARVTDEGRYRRQHGQQFDGLESSQHALDQPQAHQLGSFISTAAECHTSSWGNK